MYIIIYAIALGAPVWRCDLHGVFFLSLSAEGYVRLLM